MYLYIWNPYDKSIRLTYLLIQKKFFRVSVTIEPRRLLLTVRYHELSENKIYLIRYFLHILETISETNLLNFTFLIPLSVVPRGKKNDT